MPTVALSRNARTLFTKMLRGEVPGPDDRRACLELERAGLLAGGPGGFRVSEEGESRRREFLPEGDGPSDAAMGLFARRAAGERVAVDDANRALYRELAAWGLMAAGHSFAGGDESVYAFTREGFERKSGISARAKAAG